MLARRARRAEDRDGALHPSQRVKAARELLGDVAHAPGVGRANARGLVP
jgi:hypothetical protein